jgi:type II secretory pathway pseudopilin PulG
MTESLLLSLAVIMSDAVSDPRCGLHALYACLVARHDERAFEEVERRFDEFTPPYSFADLRQVSQALGYQTCVRTWNRTLLNTQAGRAPAVILLSVKGGEPHFVAVIDTRGTRCLLADLPHYPGWVEERILREKLGWSGQALHLSRDQRAIDAIRPRDPRLLTYGCAGAALLFGSWAVLRRTSRDWRIAGFRRRRGWSMVELLVVLGVLSFLMALLTPAIQSAREQARGVDCRSRLRQLGLAMHSYQDASAGWLPPALQPALIGRTGTRRNVHSISIQAQLLPYLDQRALWEPLSRTGWAPTEDPAGLESVPIFNCPSDSSSPGSINYRLNNGTAPGFVHDPQYAGINTRRRGLARLWGYRTASITDGLSHTGMFSERVQGDREPRSLHTWRDRVVLSTMTGGYPEELQRVCGSATTGAPHVSNDGGNWAITAEEHTLYTHVLTPNSPIVDCAASGDIVASARSWHYGTVNLLLCDGGVRPIDRGIDRALWRALATPDCGDAME